MVEAPRILGAVALLLLAVQAAPAASAALSAPCVETRMGDDAAVILFQRSPQCSMQVVTTIIIPLPVQASPGPMPTLVDRCVLDGSTVGLVLDVELHPTCSTPRVPLLTLPALCEPEDASAPAPECCDVAGCCTPGDADPVNVLVCEVREWAAAGLMALRQRIGQEGDDPWCLDVGQGPDDSLVLRYDPDHACTDQRSVPEAGASVGPEGIPSLLP